MHVFYRNCGLKRWRPLASIKGRLLLASCLWLFIVLSGSTSFYRHRGFGSTRWWLRSAQAAVGGNRVTGFGSRQRRQPPWATTPVPLCMWRASYFSPTVADLGRCKLPSRLRDVPRPSKCYPAFSIIRMSPTGILCCFCRYESYHMVDVLVTHINILCVIATNIPFHYKEEMKCMIWSNPTPAVSLLRPGLPRWIIAWTISSELLGFCFYFSSFFSFLCRELD